MSNVNNKNFCLLINGRPRSGKSSKLKSLLKTNRKNLVIYDVNNEHKEFYNDVFMSMENFLIKHQDKENTLFVIEEATAFFSTRSTNDILKDMIIRRRHCNNDFVLIFHGFYFIPKYIFTLSDYITIFKTNDSESDVKSKVNKEILNSWIEVQESENPHYSQTITI